MPDKNCLNTPPIQDTPPGQAARSNAASLSHGKCGTLLCLGIESSCDETALALYQGYQGGGDREHEQGDGQGHGNALHQESSSEQADATGAAGTSSGEIPGSTTGQPENNAVPGAPTGKLLGSVLASQAELHALFGGVVPELASREHYRLIGRLYDLLLKQTGVSSDQIDLVAVARGPGLLGALLVGMGFAKGICLGTGAKLLGVNHLEGHLLACGLEQPLVFPALGLLVSGGHTHIYRIDSPQKFRLLGRTLDDAAGEAFDKVAKLLRLPYPGGKWLDSLGQRGIVSPRLLPKPYLDNDNLDFSFSGLKTAAGTYIAKHPELLRPELDDMEKKENDQELTGLAASFNHSVAATLSAKLRRALVRENENAGHNGKPKAIILAGGVASNSFVRRYIAELAKEFALPLLLPSPALCTDNASMIAYSGWLLGREGLSHTLNLGAVPKGRAIPDDYSR